MKLISFNINGIRSILLKPNLPLLKLIEEQEPDILCLQEVRTSIDINTLINWNEYGYHYIYQNNANKKGYSGTAILSKIKPISVIYNFSDYGLTDASNEGRVITLEFDKTYIITVYTPNSKSKLERLTYRTEQWDPLFSSYINFLQQKKTVILSGDFNCAHQDIDIHNPKTHKHNAGFTTEERNRFNTLLIDNKLTDIFRYLYPKTIRYTWWSNFAKSRARNVGWRIDYWLVDNRILDVIKNTEVLCQYVGSDHCPILLILNSDVL